MARCEWTEETIIDLLLEKSGEQETFQDHIEHCPKCQSLYNHWSAILETTAEKPPRKIRKRLLHTITKKRPRTYLNKAMVFAISACALFVVFMLGRYSVDHSGSHLPKYSVQHQENVPTDLMSYQLTPVKNHQMKGYVWVNKRTKEMYMFVDGLHHMEGKDYQAWLISDHSRKSGGLLKWDQNVAHMYLHDDQIPNINQIIVSVEPQGGSDSQTGPKAFYVKFND